MENYKGRNINLKKVKHENLIAKQNAKKAKDAAAAEKTPF